MRKRDKDQAKLPPHWEKVHAAIWLIGLAILFYTNNMFPGILVLVAISGLAQAVIMAYVKRSEDTTTLESHRELYLPDKCPNCGGPLNVATVRWKGRQTALCPYCASSIKATLTPQDAAREAT